MASIWLGEGKTVYSCSCIIYKMPQDKINCSLRVKCCFPTFNMSRGLARFPKTYFIILYLIFEGKLYCLYFKSPTVKQICFGFNSFLSSVIRGSGYQERVDSKFFLWSPFFTQNALRARVFVYKRFFIVLVVDGMAIKHSQTR